MKKDLVPFREKALTGLDNLQKNNSLLLVILTGCVLLILSIGIFLIINRILADANIVTMSEIAIHDSFALNTIIQDEWKNMEVLPSTLKGNLPQTEKELMNTLRIFNEYDSNGITMLVDQNGVCYRSDGVIQKTNGLGERISPYQRNFIMRYDEAFREVSEAKEESIIFGKHIQDTVIDGHTFTYMLVVMSANEMDNKLKLDSFNDEGSAGAS